MTSPMVLFPWVVTKVWFGKNHSMRQEETFQQLHSFTSDSKLGIVDSRAVGCSTGGEGDPVVGDCKNK